MEVIDLDKENRVIIRDNSLFIQKKLFKQNFEKRDFKYFLALWCSVGSILALVLGLVWGYTASFIFIASFVFISLAVFFNIFLYFQIEELEIDFMGSFVKHRYVMFERNFKEKVLLTHLEFVQFKLLPGEVLTTDQSTAKSFELVGKKRHYRHVDLFHFLKKETALKLIPVFKDKFDIEVIDDLQNFQYLK